MERNISKVVTKAIRERSNEEKRSELLKELEENPPALYGQPVKVEEQWSYLGQQIGRNVSECVSLTIKKRIGVA